MMNSEIPIQPDQIEPVTADEFTPALRPWTTPRLQRLNKASDGTGNIKLSHISEAVYRYQFYGPS
jgi:hypothetical protein